MKKIPFIIFILPLFLVSLGLAPALADVVPKGPPVSGDIVGGFRMLNVTDGSQGVNLTVYRGDYIKFKLADPTTEPVLSIPDLSIQQRLPGNLDEAPYFKMEKSGVFPSTVAAKILIDNGFKRIFNLRQGISGWERDKHPVVQ